jgi:hypothetical protein
MSADAQALRRRVELRRAARPRLRLDVLVGVAALLALLTLLLLLFRGEGAQRRALGQLPEAERHALYLRTKANLEQVCPAPPEALKGYCQQQADFLGQFPECDASCQALAAAQHPLQRAR